jgi:hypothetical protein
VSLGIDPLAAAIGIAGLAIALLAMRQATRPTPPTLPEPTPLFEGELNSPEKVAEFVRFLSSHELRRARLDIYLPAEAATPEGNVLAARFFHLDAPPNDGFDGYEISLRVADVRSSPLTYVHGLWRLDSYVAIERPAGIWQGVLARQLVPISLSEVAT